MTRKVEMNDTYDSTFDACLEDLQDSIKKYVKENEESPDFDDLERDVSDIADGGAPVYNHEVGVWHWFHGDEIMEDFREFYGEPSIYFTGWQQVACEIHLRNRLNAWLHDELSGFADDILEKQIANGGALV